jgi:translation initiation factor 4E
VRRPIWEDPVNEKGGKWIVRLKKGVADRVWEEIVLAVIGDQFAPERGSVSVENDGWEVCGVSISVRSNNEDILAVWHKTGSDEAVKLRIRCADVTDIDSILSNGVCRDIIRKVLQLSPATVLEYKTNNGRSHLQRNAPSWIDMYADSMQDKSSFRTTPTVERPMAT